jgi:hypothetical protein
MLKTQYEQNKEAIIELIGQAKYDEEMLVLSKIEEQEAKLSGFQAT